MHATNQQFNQCGRVTTKTNRAILCCVGFGAFRIDDNNNTNDFARCRIAMNVRPFKANA